MKTTLLACCALLMAAPALAAAPVQDNGRVTVWDVPLAKGQAGQPTPENYDSVTMFLEGGTVATRHGDGTVTKATRKFGDAVFTKKGSNDVDTATSAGVHEVVIALKDTAPGPVDAPPPGMPTSFPRAGAQKTLEGDRFNVWRFSWIRNKAVPMHHHDKDTVMVFRYDGSLRSTFPTGAVQDNVFWKGQINYNKAGNTHTETLVTAHQSAVDLELK